jgi:hypothetical protein
MRGGTEHRNKKNESKEELNKEIKTNERRN